MAETTLTLEEVQKQLNDLKAEKDKLASDLEFQKNENKTAYEKRDEIKRQLEEVIEKKAKEQGEYKELYEKLKSDTDPIVTERDEYKTKYETAEQEKQKIIQERKDVLLEKIEDADLKVIAGKMELTDLEKFVEKHAKVTTDGGAKGKPQFYDADKTFDDYSSAELEQLAKDNPAIYEQLKKKKYKKQ